MCDCTLTANRQLSHECNQEWLLDLPCPAGELVIGEGGAGGGGGGDGGATVQPTRFMTASCRTLWTDYMSKKMHAANGY